MNFISAFSELEKLYEETTPKVVNKKVDDLFAVMNGDQQVFAGTKEECENWLEDKKSPATTRFKIVQGAEVPVKEACAKEELTEAADDEEIEIVDEEPVEDAPVDEVPADEEVDVEVVDDENRQVVIECSKCGALVIVNETDLVVDEASDLVNVDAECQFCEETAGYKIVGSVFPYEPVEDVVDDEEPGEELPEEDEELDEFLDVKPSVSVSLDGGEGNTIPVLNSGI